MLGHALHVLRRVWRAAGNVRRRLRQAPDYVVFVVEGAYADLPPPPRARWERWLSSWLVPPPPPSLRELGERFRAVGSDPRVRGVVLHLRPLSLTFAQLQWLRGMIDELRASGKRVVAWASSYDTATYYVACAADEVLLQPGGTIGPLGLRQAFVFLADALAAIGVEADVVQISPYKTAFDRFARREMSEESREMANWLMDGHYADLLEAIGLGRGFDAEGARRLVDGSPYSDVEGREAGVVDDLVHEDDLPAALGSASPHAGGVRMMPWHAARRRLLRPPLPPPGAYVALIRVEGAIVDGWSQRRPGGPSIPFVYEDRTGDLSVVQQARHVLEDRRAAAVLLYVDSPGGSATASEAMAQALSKVASRKPVVAWMSSVAASGGYYVCAPARWIVAEPGTVTGSIGVLTAKLVGAELLERLRIRWEILTRGERATLFGFERPFSPVERATVWRHIQRTYELFLRRVATSRHKTLDAVDAIGGGRVWTGRQAFGHGLIDHLGSFEEAARKARELAGLHPLAPVVEVPVQRRYEAAPADATAGVAGLPGLGAVSYALEGLRALRSLAPLCLCPLQPQRHV